MDERRKPDETDVRILEILVEDGRTPYSEISEEVGLSAPAVSDRVDRLEEHGIIRGFTVDVDRSTVRRTAPVVVELEVEPGEEEDLYQNCLDLPGAEQVFRTLDGRVLVHAEAPESDLGSWLEDGVDMEALESYDVRLVEDYERGFGLTATDFALDCVVCGNDVDEDGVTKEFDGETKAFCCSSCEASYREDYEELTGDP